jgi:short-subunit dehydrogenase
MKLILMVILDRSYLNGRKSNSGSPNPTDDTDMKAIVFGHTSGLGQALTSQLLAKGYQVVGIARSAAQEALPVVNIQCDLSTEDGVNFVVEELRTNHNEFDVIVYSAGTLTAHGIAELEYKSMDYLYRLNVFAPLKIESALYDLIVSNGADVVNITSSSIVEVYEDFAEYSTSKAALAKFTLDLRRALHETEARVIDLCPSGFSSHMYERMTGKKIDRDESKQMGVDDVASLVLTILALPKRIEVSHIHLDRKPV